MNVNQRARELMAKYGGAANLADYGYDSDSEIWFEDAVLDMLIIALTPPEGFVLVPVEPTPAMSAAGFCVSEADHDPAGVYHAMLAARPEVSP